MLISDAVKRIDEYLNDPFKQPFFVSVECSEDYANLYKELSGLKIVRVSDYCTEDSLPDYDKLIDDLKLIKENVLLLGLGEAVQFIGDRHSIQSIRDSIFPCKIVVLCYGVGALINEFCANEPKFAKLRCCSIQGAYDCTVIGVSKSFVFTGAVCGYKELLQVLESGKHKNKIYVQTDLPIKTAHTINNAYDAVKEKIPSFSVPYKTLTDKQWQEFLSDDRLENYSLEHWRTYLSYMMTSPVNAYLKAVTDHSADYDEYQYNLLNYILEVSHTAKEFRSLYMLRKELFKDYGTDKISAYIAQAQQKGSDRVYYLTDNTKEERYEIIMAISESHTVPDNLIEIYPDLAFYLYTYVFPDNLPVELTGYFERYKLQKLFNVIDDDFMKNVDEFSKDGKRIFNYIRAKDSIIEKYDDGQTKLMWLDALGVEYLGFIQKVARELGLSLTIQIGRSVLPTLTAFNADFYSKSWTGKKEKKIEELDKTKHEGISYRDLKAKDAPVYLSKELDIIRETLEKIKGMLSQTDHSILLASDHGASRLVILHDHKNRWKMKETGKHGGRCCPISDIDTKPDYASEENVETGEKFWVLANYDRFQGARETGVELHGGATLEEVIVPIIKIELADTANRPKIKNETEKAEYTATQDPVIILFCPTPVNNLRLKIEGRMYNAEKQDNNRYKVVLNNCKKAKRTVIVECFVGDNMQTSFEILICKKDKGMTEDTFADDFFKW